MSPLTTGLRITHEQAHALLITAKAEGLPDSSMEALEQHLLECPECAQEAFAMEEVLKQLRAIPVFASRELVRTTQSRLRLRAREIQHESYRTAPMLLASGMVVLLTLLSLPFVWSGFRWVGDQLNLQQDLLVISFLLFYLIPAGASVMLAMLHHKKSQEELTRR